MVGAVDPAHANAAAAASRFDQQWIAHFERSVFNAAEFTCCEARAAGQGGHAGGGSDGAGTLLVAHGVDAFRSWADPAHTRSFSGTRKAGVLGQKAIARVHGIGIVLFRGVEDAGAIQVALRGWCGADGLCHIGHANKHGVGIGFRIDRDAGQT